MIVRTPHNPDYCGETAGIRFRHGETQVETVPEYMLLHPDTYTIEPEPEPAPEPEPEPAPEPEPELEPELEPEPSKPTRRRTGKAKEE